MSFESTQDILNRGKNYLLSDTIYPDSAVLCFQTLVHLYQPDLPLKQKELCGTAANNLGFTYYQYLQDYKAAYEALIRAKEICDDTGRPLTMINVYLNLGNLYAIFSEHVDSPELEEEAIKMYCQAFITACDNHLWELSLSSFCNLTELGQNFSHVATYRSILNYFRKLDIPKDTPLYNYANLRAQAVNAYIDNDLKKATSLLVKSIDAVDEKVTPEAWKAQAINLTATLYLKRNMPDSALYYVNGLLNGPERWGLDVKANAYKALRSIYNAIGNVEKSRDAYGRLLMVRDSLLNINHLSAINNMKFMNDLAAERHHAAVMLADADRKRKIRELILFFAGLILAIMIPLLLVIINRHRKLRRSYFDLYKKQQEILLKEDENRRLREAEMQILVHSEEKEQSSYTAPQSAISQKTHILAIMDESEEKFSTDFSLERLSELVGISSRALSSVLNDSLGITFRDLLNQYRVREACHRLSDNEHYGHLTIEAISQSVGYKSRTSLVTAFKKETGLTPSEYQRIARKAQS